MSMEESEKQIESKEGLPKRIVRVAFETFGVSEYMEIPEGMDLEQEIKVFDKEYQALGKEEEYEPGPHGVGRAFIEYLIKMGANKIKIDEFDGEWSWKKNL